MINWLRLFDLAELDSVRKFVFEKTAERGMILLERVWWCLILRCPCGEGA